MSKKIAVLTTFMELPVAYGLVPVVLNQLHMLVDNGYQPTLIAMEGFSKHADVSRIPEGVIVDDCLPFVHFFDYQLGTMKQTHPVDYKGKHEKGKPLTNFDAQVKKFVEVLEPKLKEFDVVITHDAVFQTWFVTLNQAIRFIGERNPNIKWLHWLHSGPSVKPDAPVYPHTLRYNPMKNSWLVSPNDSMKPAFASMYNAPIKSVKTVYHTFDPMKFFGMHSLSKQMIKKHGLFDCDIVCIWPTRLDAYLPKGCDHAVHVMAQLNKLCDAKLVFLNSWSNSSAAKNAIVSLRKQAEIWGLPQENLIFSSEEGKEWELGVPQQVVRDMLNIAELFILPSETETFSMAMVEAAVCKCLCILNGTLHVMKELGGDEVLYGLWDVDHSGKRITQTYNPNPMRYWMDRAKEYYDTIKNNKALMQHRKVLQKFSSKWVFKNQLKPLIEEDDTD